MLAKAIRITRPSETIFDAEKRPKAQRIMNSVSFEKSYNLNTPNGVISDASPKKPFESPQKMKDYHLVNSLDFDAPRWIDFSTDHFQQKRLVLENLVLEEDSPEDHTFEFDIFGLYNEMENDAEWFEHHHLEHDSSEGENDMHTFITPLSDIMQKSQSSFLSLKAQRILPIHDSVPALESQTPLLRRVQKDTNPDFNADNWSEDDSPIVLPDSRALNELPQLEENLRLKMGFKKKAQRIIPVSVIFDDRNEAVKLDVKKTVVRPISTLVDNLDLKVDKEASSEIFDDPELRRMMRSHNVKIRLRRK